MFLAFPVSLDLIVWLFEFLGHLLEWPGLFAEFFFSAKTILSQCIERGETDIARWYTNFESSTNCLGQWI
jgi:hypothetical protein